MTDKPEREASLSEMSREELEAYAEQLEDAYDDLHSEYRQTVVDARAAHARMEHYAEK